MRNKYNKDQSPLFKIKSHKRLCDVLGLSSITTLKNIIRNGDSNYYKSTIHKDNKERKIEVPLPQLKRIHQKINLYLSRIKTPDYLHSGIKKRSHITNAKQHLKNDHVVKIDIKSFYPSVKKNVIFKFFRDELECSRDVSETLSLLCTCDNHIPTGSPLSQNLSFFSNKKMFDLVNDFSKEKNITFTCYVDDITISSKVINKEDKEKIIKILSSFKYKTHKYKNYPPQCKHKEITGVIIKNGTMEVKNKHKKNISILSHRKEIFFKNKGNTHQDTIMTYQKLIGHIYSASQINPTYKNYGKAIVLERDLRSIDNINKKI
ncbi:reverse transcriptase family protein [Providencia huaxiensis]